MTTHRHPTFIVKPYMLQSELLAEGNTRLDHTTPHNTHTDIDTHKDTGETHKSSMDSLLSLYVSCRLIAVFCLSSFCSCDLVCYDEVWCEEGVTGVSSVERKEAASLPC